MRLAFARIISVLGNGFARIALAFAVLSLPGATPSDLSLVVACQAVPQLALVLVGGVIADRVSRSALMAVADVLGALSYGGLATMVLSGHAPVAALCALAVTAGTATALFSPAMDGSIPQLVPAEALQRANGLLRVGTNSSLSAGAGPVRRDGRVGRRGLGAGHQRSLLRGQCRGHLLPAAEPAAAEGRLGLGRSARGLAGVRLPAVAVGGRRAVLSLVMAATNANAGVLGPLAPRAHVGGARAWSLVVATQALGAVAGAGIAARARVTRPILAAVLFTLLSALPPALLGAGAPLWAVARPPSAPT
ncbi:MFS transporter [Streptomyces sp. NPDC001537]